MQLGSRCTHAPRPGADPERSTRTPSAPRTIRRSDPRGARARQPAHVRSGTRVTPIYGSVLVASTASGSASGVAGSASGVSGSASWVAGSASDST